MAFQCNTVTKVTTSAINTSVFKISAVDTPSYWNIHSQGIVLTASFIIDALPTIPTGNCWVNVGGTWKLATIT